VAWLRHNGSEKGLGGTSYESWGYELLDYQFHFTVEGKLTGVFQQLVGGDIEIAVIEHDIVFESGSSTTLFIPGATSFAPITLSRGFANYYELYNWLMEASAGRIVQARRSASIKMHDKNGDLLLQWNLSNAWPTKLSAFSFNKYAASKAARVSLTIVAEAIEYDDAVNPAP
jgi:phage tail-like protein